MTYEEYVLKICSRKIRYHTKKKAIYAMAQLKKFFKILPPTLSIYKCPHCKLYHLGNKKATKTNLWITLKPKN